MEWSDFLLTDIIFSETIEWSKGTSTSTIECSLNGHNTAKGIIFHIVREYHQLRNIDKSAELFIRKTFAIHS